MLDGKEDNQTRRAYLSDEERFAEDKETCKEQIAELEAQLADCMWMGKDVVKSRLELEVQLAECQRERDALRDALASLSNEFDRMHTMVSSRYVAERLQALEK